MSRATKSLWVIAGLGVAMSYSDFPRDTIFIASVILTAAACIIYGLSE